MKIRLPSWRSHYILRQKVFQIALVVFLTTSVWAAVYAVEHQQIFRGKATDNCCGQEVSPGAYWGGSREYCGSDPDKWLAGYSACSTGGCTPCSRGGGGGTQNKNEWDTCTVGKSAPSEGGCDSEGPLACWVCPAGTRDAGQGRCVYPNTSGISTKLQSHCGGYVGVSCTLNGQRDSACPYEVDSAGNSTGVRDYCCGGYCYKSSEKPADCIAETTNGEVICYRRNPSGGACIASSITGTTCNPTAGNYGTPETCCRGINQYNIVVRECRQDGGEWSDTRCACEARQRIVCYNSTHSTPCFAEPVTAVDCQSAGANYFSSPETCCTQGRHMAWNGHLCVDISIAPEEPTPKPAITTPPRAPVEEESIPNEAAEPETCFNLNYQCSPWTDITNIVNGCDDPGASAAYGLFSDGNICCGRLLGEGATWNGSQCIQRQGGALTGTGCYEKASNCIRNSGIMDCDEENTFVDLEWCCIANGMQFNEERTQCEYHCMVPDSGCSLDGYVVRQSRCNPDNDEYSSVPDCLEAYPDVYETIAYGGIADAIEDFWDGATDTVDAAGSVIGDAISNVVGMFGEILGAVGDLFGGGEEEYISCWNDWCDIWTVLSQDGCPDHHPYTTQPGCHNCWDSSCASVVKAEDESCDQQYPLSTRPEWCEFYGGEEPDSLHACWVAIVYTDANNNRFFMCNYVNESCQNLQGDNPALFRAFLTQDYCVNFIEADYGGNISCWKDCIFYKFLDGSSCPSGYTADRPESCNR